MTAKIVTFKTTAIDHVETGHAFRRVRVDLGLSLRGMAECLGCSAPWVSDLENGNRCWTKAWAVRFNEVFAKHTKANKKKKP